MADTIYKICALEDWQAALRAGHYVGSADDHRDGFIHFSLASQLAGTAAKYLSGRDGLVLLAVDAKTLGPALRHEPSRGGQLFPHLYAVLPVSAVRWCEPLPWDAAHASHVWPERLHLDL